MTESKSELVSATEDAPSGRLSTASSRAPVTSAGRELDIEIEERIFGATVQRDEVGRKHDWYPMDRIHFTNGGGFPDSRPVRPYSTSIADAWLVVEKMREQRLDFSLRFVSTWTAEFDSVRSGANGYADGETAPLAICLAALKAVGG